MEHPSRQDPATPEEIWKILREVSENQKETDRLIKENAQQMKETDRRMQETDRQIKETAQQMKETDRRIEKLDSFFNTQWGKLMESLVEGDLAALMQERGRDVYTTHTRVKGRLNGKQYEFDILASNGAEVVVVEVKTTLKVGDVRHFLAKLKRFTEYVSAYEGKRVYGAVAYLKAEEETQLYAQRRGLYVIRATGSSASIINKADFEPRVFD